MRVPQPDDKTIGCCVFSAYSAPSTLRPGCENYWFDLTSTEEDADSGISGGTPDQAREAREWLDQFIAWSDPWS